MIKDQFVFIHHIDDAISSIETYKQDVKTYEEFVSDNKTQDAIIRKLEIVGEAMNHVDKSFLAKYPNIDWKGPINLRNIISHEYFNLNLKIIWKIFNEELPALKSQVKEILKDEVA
ncbi:MAG: DUF86 domain-containing protein [Patescibacteria group bacterium]